MLACLLMRAPAVSHFSIFHHWLEFWVEAWTLSWCSWSWGIRYMKRYQ
jgi:hypothetical protein